MICYDNKKAKLVQVWSTHGTVIRSTVYPVLYAITISLLFGMNLKFQFMGEREFSSRVNHPMIVQVFSLMGGVLLVARSKMALDRYTRGAASVTAMIQKWKYAFTFMIALLRAAEGRAPPQVRKLRQKQLQDVELKLCHYFSLLVALAASTLQVEYDGQAGAKVVFPHEFKLKPLRPGSRMVREPLAPSILRRPPPQPIHTGGCAPRGQVTTWCTTLSTVDFFDVLRTPDPLNPGEALPKTEKDALMATSHPVALVQSWIFELFSLIIAQGLTGQVPAPILTRPFQELSAGVNMYTAAQGIAFVPFPFSFSQMCVFLLVLIATAVPLFVTYVTASTTSDLLTVVIMLPLLSAICVFGFFGLLHVCAELEQPFGNDTNDLPLRDLQKMFHESIEQSLRPENPVTTFDLVAQDHPNRQLWARGTKGGPAGRRDLKTGWDALGGVNSALAASGVPEEFSPWLTQDQALGLTLDELSAKFKDRDVALLARSLLQRAAQPSVSKDAVDEIIAGTREHVEELKRLEDERARLKDILGQALLMQKVAKPKVAKHVQGEWQKTEQRVQSLRQSKVQQRGTMRSKRLENARREQAQLRAALVAEKLRGEADPRAALEREVVELEDRAEALQVLLEQTIDRCDDERHRAKERLEGQLQDLQDRAEQLDQRGQNQQTLHEQQMHDAAQAQEQKVTEMWQEARGEGRETHDRVYSNAIPRGHDEAAGLIGYVWSKISSKKLADVVRFVADPPGTTNIVESTI